MLLRCTTAAALALAACSTARAADCNLAIEGNDAMAFDKTELVVPAGCADVTVTLKHTGTLAAQIMGHNWVLTETKHFDALAAATATADAADGYLPKNDARVIAHTALIGGGESATVKISVASLTKGGDYTYFCAYPGHWSMMKGKLVIR
ncbi:MAG TPA: azurin [Tahibacter sp.]|nr:azurin [Tahibacter sp.]